MNVNFKSLLLGTSLSLIPDLSYAQCAVTDCPQLGYTSLKSCDGGLKCPFGEYWACPELKAELGTCTGYAQNCSIGQILNSDGTCTTNKETGKTPIGVVIYIDNDNCGYAMTANSIQLGIQWSTEYVNTGTFQTSYPQQAIKDFNVRDNMTAIIQASNGDSSKYPAAYAALNYAPDGISEIKGKWMLPSLGLLHHVYINLNKVNNTISKLGGIPLEHDNEGIWSSSECHNDCAWFLCTPKDDNSSFCSDGVGSSSKIYNSFPNIGVRPVIAF